MIIISYTELHPRADELTRANLFNVSVSFDVLTYMSS